MRYLKTLFLTILISVSFFLRAGEGMWIPLLLQLNEGEMQSMGMRLSAEDIYSINQACLKDAIVIFGRGCTGEVVSEQGLLLTNHHCGYGAIQRHSSIEHDYLTDGFWAGDLGEELPNPGLTATFLIRIEDVSEKVLQGIDENMTEAERSEIIRENTEAISKEATEDTHYTARIAPFYYGNEYYMFIYETFKDVRLVGAPPSNIGKFGGDTDNWMWPRHTGDFSVFRIYADNNNEPAEYSEDNVPYKPKKHLNISLKGADKGDFTFVFGYPGSTSQYLPSTDISLITGVENPIRIDLRGKALDVIKKYTASDDKIRIQYAAKHAGIANGWKKWIGENRGIKRLDAVAKKESFEKEFTSWAKSSPELQKKYGGLLPRFREIYEGMQGLTRSSTYLQEAGMRPEILSFAYAFGRLDRITKETPEEEVEKTISSLKSRTESHFKDYNARVDKDMFSVLYREYLKQSQNDIRPKVLKEIEDKYQGDIQAFVDKIFQKSMFSSKEEVMKFLDSYKAGKNKKLIKDPAYQLYTRLRDFYRNNLASKMSAYSKESDSMMRLYMKAQMEMQPEKNFYPDANFTLRVTYGKVDDYYPRDAVHYKHYTTLEGIMEKENPDIYDYVVEDRLKDLYNTKDYGPYADADGSMHVCFIARNHTSGGNSGSPVLDADGNLIGLNFDRNWEGTMSDLMYDPDMCRNITLDVRYCLFIIDKYAGASHLIEEMSLIE